jgi:hypothetical protein
MIVIDRKNNLLRDFFFFGKIINNSSGLKLSLLFIDLLKLYFSFYSSFLLSSLILYMSN